MSTAKMVPSIGFIKCSTYAVLKETLKGAPDAKDATKYFMGEKKMNLEKKLQQVKFQK